jgi:hypothetical protein
MLVSSSEIEFHGATGEDFNAWQAKASLLKSKDKLVEKQSQAHHPMRRFESQILVGGARGAPQDGVVHVCQYTKNHKIVNFFDNCRARFV